MIDKYKDSWRLYKKHTETFDEDIEYYYEFCKGYKTLELFAGYGRISNALIRKGLDLTTLELNADFARNINLSTTKCKIGDVVHYQLNGKFERIIAGYNSFCLITNRVDIQKFFCNLSDWLSDNGKISLNYFHQDFWDMSLSSEIEFEGKNIKYNPSFTFSEGNNDACWIDSYEIEGRKILHKYNLKLYKTAKDLLPFLDKAGLKLTSEVHNFNKQVISEPGWIDYILEKK